MFAIISFILIMRKVVNIYIALIIVYTLLSWFAARRGGVLSAIYNVLAMICEPYLSLFRRLIPVMGSVDFSPIVAVLALSAIENLVERILL